MLHGASAYAESRRRGRGLERLRGGVRAGPGPLEIIAAKPAGDVDRFADGEEPGNALCLHRLRRQFGSANAADRDLGLGEALASVRRELPLGEAALGGVECAVGYVPKLKANPELFGKRLRKSVGKRASEQPAKRDARIVALCLTKPAGAKTGQEVDRH